MQTVFEIFGIENKETKVSNYFAFLIGENRAFLKMLCDMAGIALDDGEVFVDREFLFTLDGYDNKRYYIDILVRVGDQSAPSQIICIENKIYASEGYKQTERYKKGMEKCFPKARKNYIYLTKNNSYINLSSIDFVQIKFL